VAAEHNFLKFIGDIEVCTDSKILQIKVPNVIIFVGTEGFPARRDGR
jgi:hypothetical protein